MALIAGNLISAISGRIGATEFAMTRNGIVAKQAKRRPSPSTPSQAANHATQTIKAQSWASLDWATRRNFEVAAGKQTSINRVGTRRPISGYQLYLLQQPDWTYLPGRTIPNPPPSSAAPQLYAIYCYLSTTTGLRINVVHEREYFKDYWIRIAVARFPKCLTPGSVRNWTAIGDLPHSSAMIDFTSEAAAKGIIPAPGETLAIRVKVGGWGFAWSAPTTVFGFVYI